jgi:hypothetical protein
MKLQLIAVVVAGLASARVAAAQQSEVPTNMRPPAGMCRIWLDGVPPAQQPAPTDCATAVKNRPQNGHVIFGDDYVSRGNSDTAKKTPPVIQGFAPGKTKGRPRIVLPTRRP